MHQAIPYIVSDIALNQAFPLVHFYQRCLYCFSGMGMEYSLRKQLGVSICDWVERVLDWETYGLLLSLRVLFLKIFFFFLNLPPKTGQSRLAWLLQNEFSFTGQLRLDKIFFFNCHKTTLLPGQLRLVKYFFFF